MSLGFNTVASRRGRRKGFVRSIDAVAVGLVLTLATHQMASRPAAADDLQSLTLMSLSSGLIDITAMDIDAADRALAISRAPMDMQVANSRTFLRQATGSLMADASSITDSMPSIGIRPDMRRIAEGNLADLASSAEVSDLLPLTRAAFPLLVSSLAADIPSIKASSASLRLLAGPVVGVRSSFPRPGVVASR
jgi:hypothetical protein